jgi:hypothetical protein
MNIGMVEIIAGRRSWRERTVEVAERLGVGGDWVAAPQLWDE